MVHNPATATHRPRFPRSPARHPSFFSSQPISFYRAGRFVSPPALSHDSLASSTPRVDAHADARRTTRPRASAPHRIVPSTPRPLHRVRIPSKRRGRVEKPTPRARRRRRRRRRPHLGFDGQQNVSQDRRRASTARARVRHVVARVILAPND